MAGFPQIENGWNLDFYLSPLFAFNIDLFRESCHSRTVPKRRLIALAVLLASVIAGLVWFSRRPPEPIYQGRRLSEWLDDYNRVVYNQVGYSGQVVQWNEFYDNKYHVSEAIRAMGTSTLPFLLAHIHAHSTPEQRLRLFLSKHRLFKFLSDDDDPYTAASILALRGLGVTAVPVLADLRRKEETSPDNPAILTAFEVLGASAVPALQSLCENGNATIRADAAEALAVIEQERQGARASWVMLQARTSLGTNFLKVWRFQPTCSFFAAGLESTNSSIRRASAAALAGRGYAMTTSDIVSLLVAMKDPDAEVRQAAADSFRIIAPTTPTRVMLAATNALKAIDFTGVAKALVK